MLRGGGPANAARPAGRPHSRRRDYLVANADGGAEHMIPYPRGHAEVSASRRVVMAHVPGAKIIEVRGRGCVGVMVDDMMHDPVPPVAEHDADGETVRDIEPQAPPCGNQDRDA